MTDPAAYQQWLDPGFQWLSQNWTDDQTWPDVRDGFLAQLGVGAAELGAPEYRVLALVVEQADYATDAAQAREAMIEDAGRFETVARAVAQADQEAAAAAAYGAVDNDPAVASDVSAAADPTAADEPQWVEGYGWMRYDAAAGEWVVVDGGAAVDPSAGAIDPAADAQAQAAAGEPQWVEGHGWMRYDAAVGNWVLVDDGMAAAGPSESVVGPSESVVDPSEPAVDPSVPAADPSEPAAAAAPPDEIVIGASDPELARQVAEMPDDDAALLTEAVQEELAPVLEDAMATIDGLDQLSPEDIQEALAAALAEVGDTAAATN